MKSWCKALFACSLSVGILSACSSTDVEEEPVSELKDIQASVFPMVSWSESVGDGVGNFYSRLAPAVRYGKLFVADRAGLVRAFNEDSGEPVWSVDLNDSFKEEVLPTSKGIQLSAGITAARNKVFIGGENGLLIALDAETGQILWHVIADGELLSAPTVGDDIVTVNTGNGSLQAFNVNDGASLWTYHTQLPSLTLRGTGSAAYEAGGFFVGTADGKIAVVIKTNGQSAWEQSIYTPKGGNEFARMADVDMKPLLLGDNIYAVSYNGNLVSMEMRSGRIVWSRQYSSFNELSYAGANLFVVDDHSRIYAVDRRNGLELWSNIELANRDLTSSVVFKGNIVVGDFEGYLHFLDVATGEIVGRIQVDSSGLYSRPIVIGDNLYVQARDGVVSKVTLP
ncbi:outer membrane protein assembly factor BamB [Shewanella surugensis]|uniref:Outer membrane protein assembly factor BamB n=1 Tax=Shewanella surugensis TaxID=212020 RepID=A0ABT0LBD3_9GAMM|nr:outer membrane protein assembly factor BamB [Shewanella surugensis]MCL1125006.1 outer membrane protein assembly factor BamB [Shewanella surugensis]